MDEAARAANFVLFVGIGIVAALIVGVCLGLAVVTTRRYRRKRWAKRSRRKAKSLPSTARARVNELLAENAKLKERLAWFEAKLGEPPETPSNSSLSPEPRVQGLGRGVNAMREFERESRRPVSASGSINARISASFAVARSPLPSAPPENPPQPPWVNLPQGGEQLRRQRSTRRARREAWQ